MHLVDQAVAVVSTSDFEGMPNVFLEAWTRGVPVLALSHDPDNVIERHGLGEFARGSRESLVAGAKRLWDGRHDQRELAGRCLRYIAEEHSEDVVTRQWEQVLGISASVLAGLAQERVA
jgi:glycosyltransferase involved in cell wall biosynthesis